MLLDISTAPTVPDQVEIVERKGLGHPDTICDALAEQVSIHLSRYYLENFGTVLHHNVDKVLLCAGSARPVFGGGELLEPIEIYLGGRATADVQGKVVPVDEIAIESAQTWLRQHLPLLDCQRDVTIHSRIRPGSPELAALLETGDASVPLANDSSVAVASAPLTALEHAVLEIEHRLNSDEFLAIHPEAGRDIKILGLRRDTQVTLTVARAFVARSLAGMADYLEAKLANMASAQGTAHELGVPLTCVVNVGDNPDRGDFYLTVTGTSAEAGDDGEVGRGNRVNGLITPCRPMSLEAVAGKNPVNHTGKLYSVIARDIAQQLVAALAGVEGATCVLVSQIGRPINDPSLVRVLMNTEHSDARSAYSTQIREIVAANLGGFSKVTRRLTEGAVQLF